MSTFFLSLFLVWRNGYLIWRILVLLAFTFCRFWSRPCAVRCFYYLLLCYTKFKQTQLWSAHNQDGGFDVSDYTSIRASLLGRWQHGVYIPVVVFGKLNYICPGMTDESLPHQRRSEFQKFADKAHGCGIRIIFDIPLNHCSVWGVSGVARASHHFEKRLNFSINPRKLPVWKRPIFYRSFSNRSEALVVAYQRLFFLDWSTVKVTD